MIISLRDTKDRKLSFESLSASKMVDAGGVSLADLGGVEGFDRSGEKDQLYALQLPDGVYKRKKFAPPPPGR